MFKDSDNCLESGQFNGLHEKWLILLFVKQKALAKAVDQDQPLEPFH